MIHLNTMTALRNITLLSCMIQLKNTTQKNYSVL